MKALIGPGLALVVAGGLTGCAAAVVYEDKYAQGDGWRKGTVVEIGLGKELQRPSFYDCRDETVGEASNVTYVTIAFKRNGHPYARTARLPAEPKLQVGDKVYVNFRDCTAAQTGVVPVKLAPGLRPLLSRKAGQRARTLRSPL